MNKLKYPNIKMDLGSKSISELRESKITLAEFKKKYGIKK